MCVCCDRVIGVGTVGSTCSDDYGGYFELAWFEGDDRPTLQVKCDGCWSSVRVLCCPMCGRMMVGGLVDRTRKRNRVEANDGCDVGEFDR